MFKPLHVWSRKEATGDEENKILRFYSVKLKKVEENKFL